MPIPGAMAPPTIAIALVGAGPFTIPPPPQGLTKFYLQGFVNGDIVAQTGNMTVTYNGTKTLLVAALGASQITTYPGTGFDLGSGAAQITTSAAFTNTVYAMVAYV